MGLVAWMGEPPPPPLRRWTRAANPIVLRTLPDGADPRTLLTAGPPLGLVRVDGPILLVDLPPIEGEPNVLLGELVLAPVWLEPGAPPAVDPERTTAWRDDRPDPESPFEWFRWTLVADALGEPAPGPPGDAVTQLMARHVADLWRSGLARVERRSRGVADALRRWLTATVRVPGSTASVAGWLADTADLSSLLAILLDTTREDETIMLAALAWMDARTPLSLWVESDVGGELVLAVANPLDEEMVLRAQWLGEREPPIGVLVAERSLGRVKVERPKRPTLGASLGGDDPEPLVLLVAGKEFAKRIAVAPRSVIARPPGLSFGTFVPALSLADVQSGTLAPSVEGWSTTATLRLRENRWELFLECRVPRDWDRRGDLVRCRIGGAEIVVYGDGRVEAGAEPVRAAVREVGDRWRARIELPEELLPLHEGTSVLRIGCRRETGALKATAVLPMPAFVDAIPLVEVDLGVWRDVR